MPTRTSKLSNVSCTGGCNILNGTKCPYLGNVVSVLTVKGAESLLTTKFSIVATMSDEGSGIIDLRLVRTTYP